MDDETLWLATTLARPVSPKLCIELRNWHREPGALRQALQKAFDGEPQAECPLSRQHLHALPTANTAARVNQALEWHSSSSQHHLLGLDHPLYPRTLSELPDAPLLLYAVGELTALDGPGISIVAHARRATTALEMHSSLPADSPSLAFLSPADWPLASTPRRIVVPCGPLASRSPWPQPMHLASIQSSIRR